MRRFVVVFLLFIGTSGSGLADEFTAREFVTEPRGKNLPISELLATEIRQKTSPNELYNLKPSHRIIKRLNDYLYYFKNSDQSFLYVGPSNIDTFPFALGKSRPDYLIDSPTVQGVLIQLAQPDPIIQSLQDELNRSVLQVVAPVIKRLTVYEVDKLDESSIYSKYIAPNIDVSSLPAAPGPTPVTTIIRAVLLDAIRDARRLPEKQIIDPDPQAFVRIAQVSIALTQYAKAEHVALANTVQLQERVAQGVAQLQAIVDNSRAIPGVDIGSLLRQLATDPDQVERLLEQQLSQVQPGSRASEILSAEKQLVRDIKLLHVSAEDVLRGASGLVSIAKSWGINIPQPLVDAAKEAPKAIEIFDSIKKGNLLGAGLGLIDVAFGGLFPGQDIATERHKQLVEALSRISGQIEEVKGALAQNTGLLIQVRTQQDQIRRDINRLREEMGIKFQIAFDKLGEIQRQQALQRALLVHNAYRALANCNTYLLALQDPANAALVGGGKFLSVRAMAEFNTTVVGAPLITCLSELGPELMQRPLRLLDYFTIAAQQKVQFDVRSEAEANGLSKSLLSFEDVIYEPALAYLKSATKDELCDAVQSMLIPTTSIDESVRKVRLHKIWVAAQAPGTNLCPPQSTPLDDVFPSLKLGEYTEATANSKASTALDSLLSPRQVYQIAGYALPTHWLYDAGYSAGMTPRPSHAGEEDATVWLPFAELYRAKSPIARDGEQRPGDSGRTLLKGALALVNIAIAQQSLIENDTVFDLVLSDIRPGIAKSADTTDRLFQIGNAMKYDELLRENFLLYAVATALPDDREAFRNAKEWRRLVGVYTVSSKYGPARTTNAPNCPDSGDLGSTPLAQLIGKRLPLHWESKNCPKVGKDLSGSGIDIPTGWSIQVGNYYFLLPSGRNLLSGRYRVSVELADLMTIRRKLIEELVGYDLWFSDPKDRRAFFGKLIASQ